jgi:hypothetical protein
MTTHDEEYRRLLRRSLIVTVSCILAVVICYFWVDRTVALGLSAPMLLSLVAMNYHFVSDVIAGSVLRGADRRIRSAFGAAQNGLSERG